ncbi:bifunctional adenosylcobinamide kinase/adenosylcobinamide-phosphate guanylyltransferase [Sporosarcina sp. CAU 1771]
MVRGKLTFISGGVRSGKSSYAERLLVQQEEGRLVYIATGKKTDSEMSERIEKHKEDRAAQNWTTFEQPTNLHEVIPFIQKGDLVLWDCVTTWLANEMYVGWENETPCFEIEGCMEGKATRLIETIEAIRQKAAHVVIVSNEVLNELPSSFLGVQVYSKFLGNIHQEIVEKSNVAIEMEYGIATFWKKEGVK